MANQQIHQLQGIDSSEYSPLNDSLLIHKPALGTYQGNIQNLLQAQSVDLPGTRSWNWKFLDEPLTLTGYHASSDHFSNANPSWKQAKGSGSNWDSLTSTFTDDQIRRETAIVTDDIDPSKIPYEANNLLCVAFIRNCDLYFDNGRGNSMVSSAETLPDKAVPESTEGGTKVGAFLSTEGANGKPTEKVFIVRNVPLPEDIRADGKNEHGDPVPRNFKANSFRFLVDATRKWSLFTLAVEANSQIHGTYSGRGSPTDIAERSAIRVLEIQRGMFGHNPAPDIEIDYESLGGISIATYDPPRSSVVSRSTSLDQDFLIHEIPGINRRVKASIANQNLGFYDASSETISSSSKLIKENLLDLSSPSYSREYQDDKSKAIGRHRSGLIARTGWGAATWEIFYIKCIAYN